MEALKNALAVIAGIVGVLTAILTLYAKFLDVKKEAARKDDAAGPSTTEPAHPEPIAVVSRAAEPGEPIARSAPPFRDIEVVERARQAVRAPAITLIAAGVISLFSNLFIAGFGYVDQFVTPLTTESQNQRAFLGATRIGDPRFAPGMAETAGGGSEKATVVLTIFTLMSLSVASAAAVWAGYGMLRLRGYWLSVVGSFAIMAGAGFCCMAGIPIGVWSLAVLFRPEVASSFR